MKRVTTQLLLLAGLFFLIYLTIRNLPLPQCELAHYGDSINEEGVIEYCGDEETFFFDLETLVYPVEVSLKPLGDIAVGEPIDFELTLRTFSGKPIGPEDLAVSHTSLIHLMAIDPSLQDYHHIHPQPTGVPGNWIFGMTPQKAGSYRLYFDFVTLHGARRTLTSSTITVPGEAETPSLGGSQPFSVAGVPFMLEVSEGSLSAEAEGRLTLRALPDNTENTVALERVMGAFAHVVAFDPRRVGFAHLHPLTPIQPDEQTHEPNITFAFNPQRPGQYRLWAHIKINGQEHYLPFDLEVEG